MSEYWVSKKKYFCKYCDIYIADDAPSRQQHENGLRHKGNQERFIRGLYKEGERRKKDADEEKREIARVEQAAQRAFAQDVGSGLAKASSSSSKPTNTASTTRHKPPAKPSNPYANYSTAESLGYQDPDAERIKAETERRSMQGVAGEWEVVSPPAGTSTLNDEEAIRGEDNRKREAEAPSEEDERAFKLRRKTLGAGLGDIYDPGIIPIKLKAKKEEQAIQPDNAASSNPTSNPTSTVGEEVLKATTTLPKWTKIQWKKADEVADTGPGKLGRKSEDDHDAVLKVKAEEEVRLVLNDTTEPEMQENTKLKSEDTPTSEAPLTSSGSLFKKRRTPGNRVIH